MGEEWQSNTAIPKLVRDGLDQLCGQLRDALGEQLVSVVLYGGLAKGEYVSSNSDVNVMLVLRDARVEALDKTASPRGWVPVSLYGRRYADHCSTQWRFAPLPASAHPCGEHHGNPSR